MSESSIINIIPRKYSIVTSKDINKRIKLTDGTEILFRPLTPDDIPLWTSFIQQCSRESLHLRFQGAIATLAEQGNKFCQTDYDNTIAITAETNNYQKKQIIAIAWLLKEKETSQAECALLVCDEWQHRGIGNKLGEFCQDIAIKWGIKTLTGSTTADNYRVIKMLQKYGFSIQHNSFASTINFQKKLSSNNK